MVELVVGHEDGRQAVDSEPVERGVGGAGWAAVDQDRRSPRRLEQDRVTLADVEAGHAQRPAGGLAARAAVHERDREPGEDDRRSRDPHRDRDREPAPAAQRRKQDPGRRRAQQVTGDDAGRTGHAHLRLRPARRAEDARHERHVVDQGALDRAQRRRREPGDLAEQADRHPDPHDRGDRRQGEQVRGDRGQRDALEVVRDQRRGRDRGRQRHGGAVGDAPGDCGGQAAPAAGRRSGPGGAAPRA